MSCSHIQMILSEINVKLFKSYSGKKNRFQLTSKGKWGRTRAKPWCNSVQLGNDVIPDTETGVRTEEEEERVVPQRRLEEGDVARREWSTDVESHRLDVQVWVAALVLLEDARLELEQALLAAGVAAFGKCHRNRPAAQNLQQSNHDAL